MRRSPFTNSAFPLWGRWQPEGLTDEVAGGLPQARRMRSTRFIAGKASFGGLTNPIGFNIMFSDMKSDDAERARRTSLQERAGEGASPAAGTGAQPSGKLPARSRPYACVKGERGCAARHINRSGTANCVCSSPDGRRFLFSPSVPSGHLPQEGGLEERCKNKGEFWQ